MAIDDLWCGLWRAMGALFLLMFYASPGGAEALLFGKKIDHVLIDKDAHTLNLLSDGRVLKTYSVALGGGSPEAKERRGDRRTPEGRYIVDLKNSNSRFHLSLRLSYPNITDRARARKKGVDPGGDIAIHGLEKRHAWMGPLHRLIDWTDGCIAVTNDEIEEIWSLVAVGTSVEIR